MEKRSIPTKNGAIFTSLSLWKKLTISARADWQTGAWIGCMAQMARTFAGVYNAWSAPYNHITANDNYMVSTDYLKLREITARYNLGTLDMFPQVSNIAVSASIRNVFSWDRTDGWLDPENGAGLGKELDIAYHNFVNVPAPRQFRLILDVNF